jgi:ATP-binding cassette, subfamily B, bacterial
MHGGGFMGGRQREKPSGRVSNRQLVRQTAGLFKAHRAGVAAIALLVIITAGAGVVNPVLIAVVFDIALFPTHVVNGHTVLLPVNLTLLEVLVGIMIGITIVTGAIGVLQTYVTNRVGQRVMEELRNRLYEHLQGMSLRFFTGTRTGEIQSRLSNDVGGIQSVVTDTATSLLSNIVTLLSTLIAMLVLSWQLTVLSLAITPIFVFYTYRAGRVRRQITMQALESMAVMSAITE